MDKAEKLQEIHQLMKLLKKSIKIKNSMLRAEITDKEIHAVIDIIKTFKAVFWEYWLTQIAS